MTLAERIRHRELLTLFNTQFRPSITDHPALWLELLALQEKSHG